MYLINMHTYTHKYHEKSHSILNVWDEESFLERLVKLAVVLPWIYTAHIHAIIITHKRTYTQTHADTQGLEQIELPSWVLIGYQYFV